MQNIQNRFFLLCLSAVCAVISLGASKTGFAMAQDVTSGGTEHWEAESTTADSITGNVLFNEKLITFENKTSLSITKIGVVEGFSAPNWKNGRAAIYKIDHPFASPLKKGNYLCGTAQMPVAATYIAVWEEAPRDPSPPGEILRFLGAYSGQAAPKSNSDESLCEIFNYDLK